MVKKEVFICDNCNRQSPSFFEGSGIPYGLGWRALTNFEFKATAQFKHETILKHFCSSNCLLEFVNNFVYGQEQELFQLEPLVVKN